MRMLVRAVFPVEASNAAVKDGTMERVMASTFDRLKPEAAYFFTQDGKRSAFLVFDMKDSSDLPVIAEPLFMGMNASIEVCPVMKADDLRAGLEKAKKNR